MAGVLGADTECQDGVRDFAMSEIYREVLKKRHTIVVVEILNNGAYILHTYRPGESGQRWLRKFHLGPREADDETWCV